MNLSNSLAFISLLRTNNNREWFQANKARYQEALKEFSDFIDQLIPPIVKLDPEVKVTSARECLFRIYRDTRFSPDKTPYKTNFGGFIATGGKNSMKSGYYVHVEPGNSMLAGGIYMPRPEVLKALRQEIYFNSGAFKKIITDPGFVNHFNVIDPFDKLKRPPKDFPADFQDIELLKHRSYTLTHSVPDEMMASEGLFEHALKVFRAMLPFNAFLNHAVENMGG